MKSHRIPLVIGVLLILGGLLGGITAWSAIEEASAHSGYGFMSRAASLSGRDDRNSTSHEAMPQRMNQMMGEGFMNRMHAAMPGSEAMMEACVRRMGGMMPGGGMMDDSE